jgi:hypothetical protein
MCEKITFYIRYDMEKSLFFFVVKFQVWFYKVVGVDLYLFEFLVFFNVSLYVIFLLLCLYWVFDDEEHECSSIILKWIIICVISFLSIMAFYFIDNSCLNFDYIYSEIWKLSKSSFTSRGKHKNEAYENCTGVKSRKTKTDFIDSRLEVVG